MRQVCDKLKAEQTVGEARYKTIKGNCDAMAARESTVAQGQKVIGEAFEDLGKLDAEIEGIKATITGAKDNVEQAGLQVKQINKELADLRDAKGQADQIVTKVLQQVGATRKQLGQDAAARRQLGAARRVEDLMPAERLGGEMAALRQLGGQLAAAAATGVAAKAQPGGAAPSAPPALSLLQQQEKVAVKTSSEAAVVAGAAATEPQKPEVVLQQDRQMLMHSRTLADKGFDQQEKDLTATLASARSQYHNLAKTLQQHQAVLADKLQHAAHTNRTVTMGLRVLERDMASIQSSQRVCAVRLLGLQEINGARGEAIRFIEMPIQLLGTLDTASFLFHDLQALSSPPTADAVVNGQAAVADSGASNAGPAAPSFVQVAAAAQHRSRTEKGLAQLVQEAVSAVKQTRIAGSVDGPAAAAPAAAAAALAQQASGADAGLGTSGPFDKVTDLIRGLIGDLVDQGNEDVNNEVFCKEAFVENEQARISAMATKDQESATALWTQAALDKIEDEIKYFGSEISRLETYVKEAEKTSKDEIDMLGKQAVEHEANRRSLAQMVQILAEDCDIPSSDLKQALLAWTATQRHPGKALVETRATDNRYLLTKRGNCRESVDLLLQASVKLKKVDDTIAQYTKDYAALAGVDAEDAREAAKTRATDLATTKQAKATRAEELVAAKETVRQKEADLLSIERAKGAIDLRCAVPETKGMRIARLQEEIDALQGAYKVLNGEEVAAA